MFLSKTKAEFKISTGKPCVFAMVGRTTSWPIIRLFHKNLGCTSAIKSSLLDWLPQKSTSSKPSQKTRKTLRQEKFSPVWIKIHQCLYRTTNWWRQKPSPDPKWVEQVENEHSIPFLCWFKNWILIPENTSFFAPDNQQMSNWKTTILAPFEMAPFSGDMVPFRGRGVQYLSYFPFFPKIGSRTNIFRHPFLRSFVKTLLSPPLMTLFEARIIGVKARDTKNTFLSRQIAPPKHDQWSIEFRLRSYICKSQKLFYFKSNWSSKYGQIT